MPRLDDQRSGSGKEHVIYHVTSCSFVNFDAFTRTVQKSTVIWEYALLDDVWHTPVSARILRDLEPEKHENF